MAKFEIPRFKYLTQDCDGSLWLHSCLPYIASSNIEWVSEGTMELISIDVKNNPNLRDTLIDLDVDDYEFEDGILRRIENAATKN